MVEVKVVRRQLLDRWSSGAALWHGVSGLRERGCLSCESGRAKAINHEVAVVSGLLLQHRAVGNLPFGAEESPLVERHAGQCR